MTGIQVNQSAPGVVTVNMLVVKNVQQLLPLATNVTRRGITALNAFLRHHLQTVKPLHLNSVWIQHFITLTQINKPAEFKLDTGAAVTVISEEVFKTLPKLELTKPCKILSGISRQKLNVLGQFTATL